MLNIVALSLALMGITDLILFLERALLFSVCFEVLTAGKHQCNSLTLKEPRNNLGGKSFRVKSIRIISYLIMKILDNICVSEQLANEFFSCNLLAGKQEPGKILNEFARFCHRSC